MHKIIPTNSCSVNYRFRCENYLASIKYIQSHDWDVISRRNISYTNTKCYLAIKLFESIPALPTGRPNEGFHKHNTLAEVKLN